MQDQEFLKLRLRLPTPLDPEARTLLPLIRVHPCSFVVEFPSFIVPGAGVRDR
jgi:hypothetical protein